MIQRFSIFTKEWLGTTAVNERGMKSSVCRISSLNEGFNNFFSGEKKISQQIVLIDRVHGKKYF